MTRRCRDCKRRLTAPSPDGYGPVCRRRRAAPTTRTTAAVPVAGQLPLEEPTVTETTAPEETHQGFDIAGDPSTHRGPRAKCHDPACEVTVPDTAAGTRPCGHGDYHQPHPWHDRPSTWCPGWTD